jgi:hypothetical protein
MEARRASVGWAWAYPSLARRADRQSTNEVHHVSESVTLEWQVRPNFFDLEAASVAAQALRESAGVYKLSKVEMALRRSPCQP